MGHCIYIKNITFSQSCSIKWLANQLAKDNKWKKKYGSKSINQFGFGYEFQM